MVYRKSPGLYGHEYNNSYTHKDAFALFADKYAGCFRHSNLHNITDKHIIAGFKQHAEHDNYSDTYHISDIYFISDTCSDRNKGELRRAGLCGCLGKHMER